MDDLVVVGFDTAGFIRHVSKYGKEFKDLARHCAKSIRPHYKSVRIVTEMEFSKLLFKEALERSQSL